MFAALHSFLLPIALIFYLQIPKSAAGVIHKNTVSGCEETVELTKVIGGGSFSTIYEGLDLESGQIIAIKVPNDGDNLNVNEQLIMSTIPEHKNIVIYKGTCLVSCPLTEPAVVARVRSFWIKMELLHPNSWSKLSSLIHTRHTMGIGIDNEIVWKVARDLTIALCHLHTHNVIHRDIKSSNIMINFHTWTIKLIDFGFATDRPIDQNDIRGTAEYFSPEIVCNNWRPQTALVDIWALGIVIYEMCTGNVPFSENAIDYLRKIHQMKISSKKVKSEQIRKFLGRCLQIDPQNRPSAMELIIEFFPQSESNF